VLWLIVGAWLVPAHWHVDTHRESLIGGGSCYSGSAGWSPWLLAFGTDRHRGDGPVFSYASSSWCASNPNWPRR
jgi:hypothetical protein